MRLLCFECTKIVSNELPEDTVVRAISTCPECIESPKPRGKVEAWVDSPEIDMFSKAKALGLQYFHMIWHREDNAQATVTSCGDEGELLEALKWFVKRIESGEHAASKREMEL